MLIDHILRRTAWEPREIHKNEALQPTVSKHEMVEIAPPPLISVKN